MSNFLIFKAAFNNSATPAIGAYTAEGATAQFKKDTSISPDYYLYNTVLYSAVQWFIPTAETTDFEFVADILTREWSNRVTYFIIADSTGTTRMRMWSEYTNWYFENSDSTATTGSPEFIGTISPTTSGGFGVFHQFRVRVRKLTESSSSVEVYVDGTLKLTATAGAALVTCAKIGFVGGVNSFGPGTDRGVKNAYVYDLSGGDVIDRGVLSGAFNRFISWMKSKFALKSDIPTVNNATLTIQKNGASVATFTANQSTNATANIVVPTAVSELTNDSGYLTSSSNLDASKLTSGTVDIARLPQGALERLIKVANEAARYALTTADVQLGDTVQQLDTGIMYVVTDTDHLDSAAGYTEYTAGTAASVPWSGVTGKPTFAAVATSGAYSDLTGTPTIPTVNNATLTIQQNGTTIDTFTANASVDKTINISTTDDTKIPLAGSNAISGDLIPSTDGTVNLGGSSYQWNNAYIKSLTINGVVCGDILTHNASEFVDVSTAQTVAGQKIFAHGSIGLGRDSYHFASIPYGKNTPPANTSYQYVWFGGNTASQGFANSWWGGYLEQRINTDGSAQGRWFVRDTSESGLGIELFVNGNDKQFRPMGNNSINLGTSTNKWISFNGINPGALSLPSMTFISLDTTNFDVTATTIGTFTPTVDGWAVLSISQKNKHFGIWILNGSYRVTFQSVYHQGDYFIFALMPVRANAIMNVYCTADDIDSTRKVDWLRLFPCKGNV